MHLSLNLSAAKKKASLTAGKPPAKGKAAAKPALKKQTQSRKRKLDDIRLQAVAAQLQVHNRSSPQLAVTPLSLAAATPVPCTGSPTVHAGVSSQPQAVQAAPPVASASSRPAPAPVTQQLSPLPEVAHTSPAVAQGAEEEASAAPAAAGRSDASTPRGAEEPASRAADASGLDYRAAAPQPDQVVQPDSVMLEVLPTTTAAVFDTAQDRQQLSLQAGLQPKAPFVGSFNSSAAYSERLEPQGDAPHPEPQPVSEMSKPELQPHACETDGTGLAACETPSATQFEALQQRSAAGAAEVAPFMQQAVPNMSAPLSDADMEIALSLLEPASARDCPHRPLLHNATAATMERLQASANDHRALQAPLTEARHELGMSETTGQPPYPSESARGDVVRCIQAKVPPASLQQPKEPSLSTAPVSIVARTHEAATRDDTDPALSGQQAEETEGTEAFEKLPLCLTLSGVQNQDKHTLSEYNQVQCSSAPSIPSAALKGDGEGTVVMLEGDSLLGLASYSGSDCDSDS